MDERTAEQLLYLEATLNEMSDLGARGRSSYDSDVAVSRASQYSVIRLASDLEQLGQEWLDAHPELPTRLIKGMRNRIAHNYWTVDDDIVWDMLTNHGPALRDALAGEFVTAHAILGDQNQGD